MSQANRAETSAGDAPKAPYRVEQETPGCIHCESGALFMVVFDDENGDECATGTSYGGDGISNDDAREAAQEIADDLCAAYALALEHQAKGISPSSDASVKR